MDSWLRESRLLKMAETSVSAPSKLLIREFFTSTPASAACCSALPVSVLLAPKPKRLANQSPTDTAAPFTSSQAWAAQLPILPTAVLIVSFTPLKVFWNQVFTPPPSSKGALMEFQVFVAQVAISFVTLVIVVPMTEKVSVKNV